MIIHQPCDKLTQLVAKYPFLTIHPVGIDCVEVRFIYRNVCDAQLIITTTSDDKVRITNSGGFFELILDPFIVSGLFRCISRKMTMEMYYMFFDLNIDVYNEIDDVVGIKRQWTLSKIIND
jgi:hypothetical protein